MPVFVLWGEVQGCWSHGFSGPVGFRWADVRAHPACRRIERAEREEHLAGLAVMERAWLNKRAELAAHEQQLKGQ